MVVPGQERMIVTIDFNDLTEPSWDARLRMTIEGEGISMRTSPQFIEPVTLFPGPNFIDGEILRSLLDISKMDVTGANKNDLVNAGRLPEGNYDFCLEITDAGRETALAQPGCFNATLIQNNPPQVIMPECGEIIPAAGAANIMFNWLPLHDPSILVEYQVRMVIVPPGLNPNDAINNTNTPILDWEPVNTSTFIYGPQFLPLIKNTTYAFQIRVVDVMGLTTFENEGKSEVCWFTYGFATGGNIPLTAPDKGIRVDYPDKLDLAWEGPDNAVNGQPLKYHIKVVKLNEGEDIENPSTAQAVMARTTGVYYDDSTDIINNIFGSNLTITQDLELEERYAWQVRASTEGTEVAISEVWDFLAPPVIYGFWAADGAVYVEVDELENYVKESPSRFSSLTGTGEAVLKEGEDPVEVNFTDLRVDLNSNKWVLEEGEILIPNEDQIALGFWGLRLR